MPEFVFVRFQTRTRWTIPGVDAENVFPVSVQSKDWFLDAGRTTPKLKVTRYQFPLAPDFADTFHAAQGSTAEPGVIPDLCGVDPLAAYVGMTRSRTRQKILIYRPFPLGPFQTGLPLGRQLLLDVWKQEPVDWDALRKKYLDERPCHECREMKRKDAFTKAQWKQETYRVCAKNALRRSARPARHIDAHSAGCGMLLVTLQASIKTPGGACTAFAYHVMLSSIVLPAKENKQRNISALQRGQPESRIEECACNAKQERVGFGLARPVTNGGHSYNFRPSLSSGLREKMELRYVTLVTQKLRRKFFASVQ